MLSSVYSLLFLLKGSSSSAISTTLACYVSIYIKLDTKCRKHQRIYLQLNECTSV
uniref:Uncharacterized protein n=1 Tax=Arundo donax TaxID=35708 RepID=A0A0A9HP85_ARUDO